MKLVIIVNIILQWNSQFTAVKVEKVFMSRLWSYRSMDINCSSYTIHVQPNSECRLPQMVVQPSGFQSLHTGGPTHLINPAIQGRNSAVGNICCNRLPHQSRLSSVRFGLSLVKCISATLGGTTVLI